MKQLKLDYDKYGEIARKAVAEGQVLLRNENRALPLEEGTRLAVFGRIQFHYYKSGTGSGGMVNVNKVTGILDALLECGKVKINQKLLNTYREWDTAHPFDEGIGWGNEPWSQEEMVLSDSFTEEIAGKTDAALIILGRTAGEDRDNLNHPGSYLLTDKEEALLETITKHFSRVIVVLNVGNVMDMRFVDQYQPDAVLYAWQGGMVGGLGTVDILTGQTNPSGKLADTIAYEIEDYPSHSNFGNLDKDIYEEDIYVGYRYFETVAKNKVRYPFGYGLSYTDFTINIEDFSRDKSEVKISVSVRNIGSCPGKEVVQVYAAPPQGVLGKASRNLAAFEKTQQLQPGETQLLLFKIPFYTFASYDETGAAGYKSCYVLEKGEYEFYAGSSVKTELKAGSLQLDETLIIKELTPALIPDRKFKRMKPRLTQESALEMTWEDVPVLSVNQKERRLANLPKDYALTGDKGYKLSDVKQGKISMETFVAQLTEEDLSCIIRGEGMGSPKVTPGTASAFGGVTSRLKAFGIPCGCCADGPSGIRMDSGMKAFSMPNGTLLACTFNTRLVEELYTYTGIELVKNKVDTLLGPGINIHRHPLNGRNFEYFSEDPLVTGKMAAAQLRGMHQNGVTGTVKHFCANNQETKRHELNSVISERALREIYLKGYEIAIREGDADSIMTTYGAVNGIWTAGSYDLNTTILRGEWKFSGIVMTDWWAKINDEKEEANTTNFAAMARAQNDLYMTCADASINGTGDNTLSSLKEGTLTRGELQRNAMNICRFLLNTPAYDRMTEEETEVLVINGLDSAEDDSREVIFYEVTDSVTVNLEQIEITKGASHVFALNLEKLGGYKVEITGKSSLGELAQIPITLLYQSIPFNVFTFNGTGGAWVTKENKIVLHNKYAVLRLLFGQNGMDLKEIKFTYVKSLEEAAEWNVL